jgi:hypothetical protein
LRQRTGRLAEVEHETPEMMLRFVAAVAAQLAPAQAEAAAADLREQARSTENESMRKFLIEGADSLVDLATDLRNQPPAESR